MANNANTMYVVYDTTENLERLHNILKNNQSMKNIISELGGNTENLDMDGTILAFWINYNYGHVYMEFETFRHHQPQFKKALEQIFPNMKIFWKMENDDDCETNSFKEFGIKYAIESEDIYETFDCIEDVREFILTEDTLTEFCDMFAEKHDIQTATEGLIYDCFVKWNHTMGYHIYFRIFKEVAD